MNITHRTLPSSETKIQRVLVALMSGRSFNCFEAEWQLHDHCLHSNISTLDRKYGITVSREFETVLGYQGKPTRVCRYWMELEERQRIETRQELHQKEEATNRTDQDKESGFHLNDADDNTAINQPSNWM